MYTYVTMLRDLDIVKQNGGTQRIDKSKNRGCKKA